MAGAVRRISVSRAKDLRKVFAVIGRREVLYMTLKSTCRSGRKPLDSLIGGI